MDDRHQAESMVVSHSMDYQLRNDVSDLKLTDPVVESPSLSKRACSGSHHCAVRIQRFASSSGSTPLKKKRHPTRHQRIRFRKRLLKLNTSPPNLLFENMNLSNESTPQEDDHLDFHQTFDRIQCNILTHLKDLSL
jgi:hypothetical protein